MAASLGQVFPQKPRAATHGVSGAAERGTRDLGFAALLGLEVCSGVFCWLNHYRYMWHLDHCSVTASVTLHTHLSSSPELAEFDHFLGVVGEEGDGLDSKFTKDCTGGTVVSTIVR